MADYYIVPSLGKTKLNRLQPAHLQRLYSQLRDRGLSERTVHHVHVVLRNTMGRALRWGNILRRIADLVDPPRMKKLEIGCLDAAQADTLLAAIKGNRWEALIVVAIAMGMRQGEQIGLTWWGIDFARNHLHGRRQRNRDGSLAEPKTAKGRRTIALPPMSRSSSRSTSASRTRSGGASAQTGTITTWCSAPTSANRCSIATCSASSACC